MSYNINEVPENEGHVNSAEITESAGNCALLLKSSARLLLQYLFMTLTLILIKIFRKVVYPLLFPQYPMQNLQDQLKF